MYLCLQLSGYPTQRGPTGWMAPSQETAGESASCDIIEQNKFDCENVTCCRQLTSHLLLRFVAQNLLGPVCSKPGTSLKLQQPLISPSGTCVPPLVAYESGVIAPPPAR